MRSPKFSRPVIIAGFALTFLFAGSLSAKERGVYAHAGLSYWNDVQEWDNESFFSSRSLPGFSTTGWRSDSSTSLLSVGFGFNFNKNWAIEAFYKGLPDLIIPGTHWLIPPTEPNDEPVSASWIASRTDGDFFGVSVSYDHYLSERVSLFLKVGFGESGHDMKLESTLTGSHRVLLDEQVPYRGGDQDTTTRVYAVGMRMPLLHYAKVSITFEYQIVRNSVPDYHTSTLAETSSGLQLLTRSVSGKASNFEIGIQWRL